MSYNTLDRKLCFWLCHSVFPQLTALPVHLILPFICLPHPQDQTTLYPNEIWLQGKPLCLVSGGSLDNRLYTRQGMFNDSGKQLQQTKHTLPEYLVGMEMFQTASPLGDSSFTHPTYPFWEVLGATGPSREQSSLGTWTWRLSKCHSHDRNELQGDGRGVLGGSRVEDAWLNLKGQVEVSQVSGVQNIPEERKQHMRPCGMRMVHTANHESLCSAATARAQGMQGTRAPDGSW